MDGTLINSLIIWDVLWERIGERYLGDKTFRPSAQDEKDMRTMPLRDAMTLLHEAYGVGASGEELLELADRICERFYAEEVEIKRGVIAFLEHCRKAGIKMCVASATAPDLLAIVMKRFGWEVYFPRIFSCSEIGKGKDFPDVFLAAHAYLGTPQETTWVFEDSTVALETAARAGFPTVGIYDDYNTDREMLIRASVRYLGENESFADLIPEIEPHV